MKKLLFLLLTIAVQTSPFAQTKKKPAGPSSAPVQPGLKSNDDSVSYAIGVSVANFFKQQNVSHINTSLVEKAINDILKAGKPLLSEQQANAVIMECMNKAQVERGKVNAAAAEGNKKVGEAFLAENKMKPGVVALPSGLQYQVIKEGSGPRPAATDKVKCHYTGKLLDGTVFDSSVQRGEPITISLENVILGWREAVQLMPVGSKWVLYIPSSLGYGDQAAGPVIKPGSTLIFELELLEIVK